MKKNEDTETFITVSKEKILEDLHDYIYNSFVNSDNIKENKNEYKSKSNNINTRDNNNKRK